MILLDTNLIVYYLHRVEPLASKAKEILSSENRFAVTLRVVDEVLFTLIRMKAWRELGIKKLSDLRNYIRRYGLTPFRDVVDIVVELLRSLDVDVLEDRGSVEEIVDTMTRYRLLPGDALIAVTCRYYGIDTIATFDEDFKRVPWLRVIP